MKSSGEDFAAAAANLLGTPFRLHGRDPASGVDCVGLVSFALKAIGCDGIAPCGYSMRSLHFAQHLPYLDEAGFIEAEGSLEAGDLLLVKPAAGQFHLLIAARKGGFIHAHAGLGRVVRTPTKSGWPVLRRWRLQHS